MRLVLAAPSLRNTNAGSAFPLMVTVIVEAAMSGAVASGAPAHVFGRRGREDDAVLERHGVTRSPGSAARLLLTSSTT